jgi:hypothetical protein
MAQVSRYRVRANDERSAGRNHISCCPYSLLFLLPFNAAASQAIEHLQSGLVDILISLLLLLFVFVMEGWIWIMRLKAKHSLSLLERMGESTH